MLRSSWLAAQLAASQEGFRSMELADTSMSKLFINLHLFNQVIDLPIRSGTWSHRLAKDTRVSITHASNWHLCTSHYRHYHPLSTPTTPPPELSPSPTATVLHYDPVGLIGGRADSSKRTRHYSFSIKLFRAEFKGKRSPGGPHKTEMESTDFNKIFPYLISRKLGL
jgi:hypothetical protein